VSEEILLKNIKINSTADALESSSGLCHNNKRFGDSDHFVYASVQWESRHVHSNVSKTVTHIRDNIRQRKISVSSALYNPRAHHGWLKL
jgi:hypothetical protein